MQPQLKEKLQSFKGLILDGDGVWFTGEEFRGILPGGDALIIKSRYHQDSQGLAFMRALGSHVLFATAEGKPLQSIVEKLNNLPSARSGDWTPISVLTDFKSAGEKVEAIEKWLRQRQLNWSQCAYIGDDRSDYEAMMKINTEGGLSATPGNGQRLIRKIAQILLTKPGGGGAIREFAEMVLDARGVDEATLAFA